MKATAFLAAERAVDDEGSDCHQIAEFEQVGRDFEIPIKFLHFGVEVSQARRCALEAFVGADDADIIPHEAADFFPVVRDDNEFIHILNAAGAPLGEVDGDGIALAAGGFFKGAVGHDHAFEERVAGEAVRSMQTGAGGLADGVEAAQ